MSFQDSPTGFLKFLILPSVAVAVPKCATMTRYIRNSVVAQKRMDYVRTARAKGNAEGRILVRHICKNTLLPVVTMLAMMAADMLGWNVIECVKDGGKCKCCPSSRVWKKLYDGINDLLDSIDLEQVKNGQLD